MVRPVGSTMKATLVVAFALSDPEAELNDNHDWSLEADQWRVLVAFHVFVMMTDCEKVAVEP